MHYACRLRGTVILTVVDTVQTWEVKVHGRVQGVFFRAFLRDEALRLGTTGWVRNERDGSVVARIQHASTAVLEQLVQICQEGTPASRVDGVEVQKLATADQYADFTITYGSPWRER